MTFENIKSILLVILVFASLLLTWNLWSYQPNYEEMNQMNTVEEVAIGTKKKANEIVIPNQILYHDEGGKHFGTIDHREIKNTIAEMSAWNFGDFVDISSNIDHLPSFVQAANNIEFVFPDAIPIDLYRTVIHVVDKNIPNFEFDRIVIDTGNSEEESAFVYFVSMDHYQVYRSTVPAVSVASLQDKYFKNVRSDSIYAAYFPYQATDTRTIFLPVEKTEMMRYQYLSTMLDSEKFKDALFSNPSLVQKNDQATLEEYTDSMSLLRADLNENTISYVKPSGKMDDAFVSDDLLGRSIDFVNSHGGWTDNYRFVEMDDQSHTVLFRLYDSKGYPIFSEDGKISEFRLIWGQNEINEYLRSNFSLGLRTEPTEVMLSSGEAVIDYLQDLDGFESEKLQDVQIGYKMTKDPQTRLVHLEPSWYYCYDQEWKSLSMDVSGGVNRGLE